MVSQKVTIKNPTGLHLRPAGILCKEAMQFKSHVTFRYRENTANAKSVLVNLEPKPLKGIVSQGMILMAENADGTLSFVSPDKEVKPGSEVR